jgi:hypothetical protein
MAQFTGTLNEATPSTRTEGEVSEPSATLKGIARVVLCDEFGNPVSTIDTAAPGSSPDNPVWVGSATGDTHRTRLEGGNVSRIDEPVTVRGTVTTELGALTGTLLGQAANVGDIEALLLALSQDMARRAGDAAVPNGDPAVVLVDGVVSAATRPSTAFYEGSLTVSTTAVRIAPVNASRKCLTITNNSTGDLYVGLSSGVTASGSGMGRIVASKGSFTDGGEGVWCGERWAIYSASASSANVSVEDLS